MSDEQEIKCTTDYNIFTHLPGNRGEGKISEKRVIHLMESIRRRNLLHVHPILVNKAMLILRGHHRLEAAKRLGVPIYYQICDISLEEVLDLEKANSSWTVPDILACRAANGHEECKKLYDIVKNNGISLHIAAAVCTNSLTLHLYPKIRSGDFILERDLPNLKNRVEKCLKIFEILRQYYPKGGERDPIIRAIGKMVGRNDVIFNDLSEKVDQYPHEVAFHSGMKKVYKDLVKVYNKNRKEGKICL